MEHIKDIVIIFLLIVLSLIIGGIMVMLWNIKDDMMSEDEARKEMVSKWEIKKEVTIWMLEFFNKNEIPVNCNP